jgi:ribosomal protein L16/L10AE
MMSNEEWDRKIEFLLNQQAEFDIDMRRLEAAQAASERRLDRTAEVLSSYATILFENFKITDARIRELTESQKLTDEELRKFIAKVDRLTGEDQNGLQN